MWLPYIFGGGGLITAIISVWKLSSEKKHLGAKIEQVRSETQKVDTENMSSAFKAMLQAQTESLIEPLQAEVKKLRATQRELEIDIRDFKETKSKLGIAITYIRELYHWVRDNIPENDAPDMPSILREELEKVEACNASSLVIGKEFLDTV